MKCVAMFSGDCGVRWGLGRVRGGWELCFTALVLTVVMAVVLGLILRECAVGTFFVLTG